MKRYASTRSACVLTTLFALAGCAGGGGGVAAQSSGAAPSSNGYRFAIAVPARATATANRGRKPNYFSPSTQSIRIDVAYANATVPTSVVAGLNAGASNCTGANTSGLLCTVDVTVQSGAQTFALTTYDAAGATGNVLSNATIAVPAPNAAITLVTVTLTGVVAKLGLQFVGTVPTIGTAGTFTLAVSAFDADGNTIVGPGNYASPIMLTSDSSAFGITPNSVAAPGSTVTVTYAGSTTTGAHLTATTTSAGAALAIVATLPVFGGVAATPSPVPTATPTLAPGASPTPSAAPTTMPAASPSPGSTTTSTTNLYVANAAQPGVARYPTPLSGGSSPNLTFAAGSGTVTPNDVEVDASGNVAVTLTNGTVDYYPGPLGASAPSPIVLGSAGNATGFASFDASGDLFVATQGKTVVEYTPPFTAGKAPSLTIANAAITDSYGVSVDGSNNVYVTNGDTSQNVLMFAPPYTGNPLVGTLPATTSSGGYALRGAKFDTGLLFVVDSNGGAVYGFNAPFTTGSNNGVFFISAPDPGTRGLAIDSVGDLFVSNASKNVIYEFQSPYAPGDSPAFTITTGVKTPFGISFGR